MSDPIPVLKSAFLNEVINRGYPYQCSNWSLLDAILDEGPQACYVGYDATADSLHVGHLVSIMLMRRWQQAGHKPIVLMGGGTTKLGDPSFKTSERPLLSDAEIASNMEKIKGVYANYIRFGEGPGDAVMVNNDEWLSGLQYVDFLREYGRHFSVNRMLSFDSVKTRLEREQSLSFLEFNYMILQSYDFVVLARRFGCRVQIGGSDQWGNIISGVELGHKLLRRELVGLTVNLVTTSGGQKMGKSEQGAVWLAPEKLSHHEFYQFWRNSDDADVIRFLKLFTDLSLEEISTYARKEGRELNEAKKRLAFEATKLCRGEEAAREAEKAAQQIFEKGGFSTDLPTLNISEEKLNAAPALFALIAELGLAVSRSEARRQIRGGGARLNDQPISDESRHLEVGDFNTEGFAKLSVGRKRHGLLKRLGTASGD